MVDALPTGVISFLFTDVVGSTRLWEADPGGMAASVELHDSIVRRQVDEADGHVFSTAGDGFAAAFTAPQAAISTAVRIQREFISADWPGPALQVRMGLHMGAANERKGDYFGPVVNLASRIQAAGHGGQILVSATAVEAAEPWLEPGIDLHDLGRHRLKDVAESVRLFDVRHPELEVVSEPIRALSGPVNNLPEYLTTFVGRTAELKKLEAMLGEHRLVVLTGVGGTGKTRLAVEVGRKVMTQHRDGVWLVELAPVTDPARVTTAIGDIWGLRSGEGATIDDVVARYLKDKDLLLVIDNCEHVLSGAASAIRHLLESGPGIRVMATSRESLGVAGEALLHVPSLGLPTGTGGADSESVQLFLQRTEAARPDLNPGSADLEAIERICRRVDGIPLGIELAAARIRTVSPGELAKRLEESFRILAGSAKAALPRQRTLSATVEWSYDLLEPEERTLFRRLAVFAGGFDLDAAEAVCAGEGVDEWEILDHLDSLVDKSLVSLSEQTPVGTRYRMLEPVRQYAQETLAGSGEAAEIQREHARYFSDLVGRASERLRGPEQQIWARRLNVEYPNIRAAFTTLSETGDVERHLQMSFDLFPYWMSGGMQIEAIETALVGLESTTTDTDSLLSVKTWWTTAMLGAQITRPSSVEHARRGLAVAEEIGDRNSIGRMELILGAALRHATTDPAYIDHLREGRQLLDEEPEPSWWEPVWDRALTDAILFEYLPEEDERQLDHFEAAVAGFTAQEDEAFLSLPLIFSFGSMEVDEATAHLQRAVEITERLGLPLWRGHALFILGIVRHIQGEHAAAIELLAAGAGDLQECGDMNCWATANRGQAVSEAKTGAHEAARRRLAAVIGTIPRLPKREIHELRSADAVTQVLAGAGDYERAAVSLGLARTIQTEEVSFAIDRGHDDMRDKIAAALGEEETESLLAEGASMTVMDGLTTFRAWLQESKVGS
jgi:predicted ATPase/class 3 adenylate cyclase